MWFYIELLYLSSSSYFSICFLINCIYRFVCCLWWKKRWLFPWIDKVGNWKWSIHRGFWNSELWRGGVWFESNKRDKGEHVNIWLRLENRVWNVAAELWNTHHLPFPLLTVYETAVLNALNSAYLRNKIIDKIEYYFLWLLGSTMNF